jgi:hypothetical protein
MSFVRIKIQIKFLVDDDEFYTAYLIEYFLYRCHTIFASELFIILQVTNF